MPSYKKGCKIAEMQKSTVHIHIEKIPKAKHYKKAHHSLTEVGNRIPNLFLNMTTTNLTIYGKLVYERRESSCF